MSKDISYYTDLLIEYINHTATVEAVNELWDFAEEKPEQFNTILESDTIRDYLEKYSDNPYVVSDDNLRIRMRERLMEGIAPEAEPERKVRRMVWRKWAAAAAIITLLASGYWLFYSNKEGARDMPLVAAAIEAPDRNKATITLADGKVVYLEDLNSGNIALQEGVMVYKDAEGNLVYEISDFSSDHKLVYNTLYNPRGSKVIDIRLSDGSHVWLNAGSSISYPVVFAGTERRVKMEGEAYFEINPDPAKNGMKKPFIVEQDHLQVEVLGTWFNVNAYENEEDIKVTLLEGSVNVSHKAQLAKKLSPGQQARIAVKKQEAITVQNSVDIEKVMAWKNGLFDFDDAGLREVMKQLERWYDIEVVVEEKVPEIRFGGNVTRGVTLNQLLEGLKDMGAQFRLEGRTLRVSL